MKINYKILWIDDRPKQVSAAMEHVKTKLDRLGFILNLDTMQQVTETSLRRAIHSNDYDLLVVDYKLEPGSEAGDGDKVIRSIRKISDMTDIVFYSSEKPGTLRTKINVDGVYCFNRDELPERLNALIDSRIKKLVDLNQMRGIYLSAVAEFDHLIDEAICAAFSKFEEKEKQDEIVDFIISLVATFHEQQSDKISKIERNQHINEFVKILGTSPKHKVLMKVLDEMDDEYLDILSSKIAEYESDIIIPRNQLAHAMEVTCEAGLYVLKNKGKEISFNQDSFLTLRQKVLNYRATIDSIIKRVNS